MTSDVTDKGGKKGRDDARGALSPVDALGPNAVPFPRQSRRPTLTEAAGAMLDPRADRDMVAQLAWLLRAAQEGQIRGVAFVALHEAPAGPDGVTGVHHVVPYRRFDGWVDTTERINSGLAVLAHMTTAELARQQVEYIEGAGPIDAA